MLAQAPPFQYAVHLTQELRSGVRARCSKEDWPTVFFLITNEEMPIDEGEGP